MHLTVIAKAPVPGRVKTRLCPPCTHEQAAAVAAAALADTFDAMVRAVAGTATRLVLLVEGDEPTDVPAGFVVVRQRGNGLAERLANGFADLGPGFVVGMDAPEAVHFAVDGLVAVADGRNALGLCHDGGYWGIGLAAIDVDAFAGVDMSTGTTGAQQLDRLLQLGRPVTMLPTAHDIDTYDDLVALAARHSARARRTVTMANVVAAAVDAGCIGSAAH